MVAVIVIGVVLAVFALFFGIIIGHHNATSLLPPSTAPLEDSAAKNALDGAKKKAQELMHESDDAVAERVRKLRERGRSGQ
jgi:hypothetical protein